MDIEILDSNENPIQVLYNVRDPEFNFQFVWKNLIPNAADWRGYVPPTPSNEELLNIIRKRRDEMLTASDWTQMPDSPLSPSVKDAWKTYRQELRDMPGNVSNLLSPEWPQLQI